MDMSSAGHHNETVLVDVCLQLFEAIAREIDCETEEVLTCRMSAHLTVAKRTAPPTGHDDSRRVLESRSVNAIYECPVQPRDHALDRPPD